MAKNISEIPYTEIVERAKQLGRVGIDNMNKIRGIVNDVYVHEIGAKWDWSFLLTSSSITVVDEYHQGTISMNTGDTSAVATPDAVLTSAMIGRKIKFAANDTVYDITGYSNSTAITINPPLAGNQNLSGAAYSIFQPFYSLAENFDRFPKPGGVYRWAAGRKQILPELQYAPYVNDEFIATATTPSRTRLFGTDTLGNQLVELVPPPRQANNYGYDYIRTLKPLSESTAGTISSVVAGQTVVLGNTNARFTEAGTDGTFFFRVDGLGIGQDSQWYKILSVQNDSQMTLAVVFANTSITNGASYTISRAPEMPPRLHTAVLYGALRYLTQDQNDPNTQLYNMEFATTLSDAKKILVSRPYSQEITGVFEDYLYRR